MTIVLITGAFGQIGTDLVTILRQRYGAENVLATGRRLPEQAAPQLSPGPMERLDVTDGEAVLELITRRQCDVIYHLAARLSAVGEQHPTLTWKVNMDGLRNVLEAARFGNVGRVFWPSSIAAFGPETPRDRVPQDTVMRPTTIYGVSKVAGELLCDYYFHKYGLDVRGVRYPGVISSGAAPGGGTTDYAVEMFYEALRHGRYKCFVREDCVLPMIYMHDCTQAATTLMDADLSRLRHHNSFNVASMSFSAGELAAAIKKHIPEFVCEYVPDERQTIAETWPRSVDDSAAREQWGWTAEYDLDRMTVDMLTTLRARQRAGTL